ncbi:UDP-galactopyranose/dTDP-fucopyranose mutase family protein [Dokdonella sp. MW10]|uniref:UDP-galactopyranose/dTDP-fucopyranose mutase family protein n=1 Tax=Dokdonella sp. MW10 TaxID=2992926 RepID=UPI003F7F40F1
MKTRIACVGAGFASAVLARSLAESGRYRIDVFESRGHVGGNCHTSRDPHTNIMVHHYGPHIFNTSRRDVWDYVNRFGEFGPFVNRVKARTARGTFSLPINLLTINQFFGENFTPEAARRFVESIGDQSITDPVTFEDQALRFLGRELYENFFHGYTKKQWGVEPSALPASILQRLPVRFSYDDNYYNQTYQGIPLDGYTAIVERILDHPDVSVHVGETFKPASAQEYDHVYWSGPMDSYFDFRKGRLQYRSLRFERMDGHGDEQGNAVINYCEEHVPYTRVAEHKHFAPWESHADTVLFREYSSLAGDDDIPYYPLRLTDDKAMLREYVELAEAQREVTFIGRLGTYRYLDMHVVIAESLALAADVITHGIDKTRAFSVRPLHSESVGGRISTSP